MSYYFYLDNVLMPVTPSAMEVKIRGKNEVLELANGGELPILRAPGLTEIRFSLLLPNASYPFSQYRNGFEDADRYLALFERLMIQRKPFPFLVIRTLTSQTALRMAVGLTEYGSDAAKALTGDKNGKITSSHARAVLLKENSGEMTVLSDTEMTVTLEQYEILEDAEKYGGDFFVALTLRQYRDPTGTAIYTKGA